MIADCVLLIDANPQSAFSNQQSKGR